MLSSSLLFGSVSQICPVDPPWRKHNNTISTPPTQAEGLATECCRTMAVVGAKLRRVFGLSSRSPKAAPSPSPPPTAGGGAQLQQQRRQTSSLSGSVPVAAATVAATAAAVRRLAEACAPGRGGGGGGSDSDVGGREFPGLSLTASMLLAERTERRGGSARGSAALVGACTALHVHVLEWLALVAVEGGDARDSTLPAGTAAAAAAEGRRQRAAGASEGMSDFLVGFARRTLLDILFLFEKRRPAPGARRRGASRQEQEEEAFSKDPSAELLCAVMDTLDGTGVGKTLVSPPQPPSFLRTSHAYDRVLLRFLRHAFISSLVCSDGAVG